MILTLANNGLCVKYSGLDHIIANTCPFPRMATYTGYEVVNPHNNGEGGVCYC